MSDIPVEKKFAILCDITRAQHFAWHEAVRQMCPGADPAKVTDRMWEISGHETARAYLKKVAGDKPLAPQIAAGIVWSSECMGETAAVEATPGKDEAFVRHAECPWFGWHQRTNLISEDRPGCDVWFRTIVEDVNKALGTRLRVETIESLPEGGKSCLRRFWVEG